MYSKYVDVRICRPDLFSLAVMDRCDVPCLGDGLVCNRTCPPSVGNTPSETAIVDPTCQIEITLLTEKEVLNACPGGFTVPFSFSGGGGRKLIVRKDIAVERLMKAVNEHFKIPLTMQRLMALRYYPDTQQERFELMHPSRSIMAHLPPSSHLDSPSVTAGVGGTAAGASKGGQNRAKGSTNSSGMYVLVSACRQQDPTASVWVKIFDENNLGLINVCLIHMDSRNSLRDYFDQVSNRAVNNPLLLGAYKPGTQYIVFEEISTRSVELRRTTVPIKDEKIIDGDILIFVPLTDAAKRALIGTSLGGVASSSSQRPQKRRLLTTSAASAAAAAAAVASSSLLPPIDIEDESSEFDDDDDQSYCDNDVGECACCPHDDDITVDERCRRFLERARADPSLIDEAYEEMILNELMLESTGRIDDDDSDTGDSEDDEGRFENIRKIICERRKLASNPQVTTNNSGRIAELMSDLIKGFGGPSTRPNPGAEGDQHRELFDGVSRKEIIKDGGDGNLKTRRLELPLELRDEISKIPAPICFYCQLPLTSLATVANQRRTISEVACTTHCVPHRLMYHDRCLREASSRVGDSGCVITENCPGKLIVTPPVSRTKQSAPAMSTAALRAKLGSVLVAPPAPSMEKSGSVNLGSKIPVWKSSCWGSPPSLPNKISAPKKIGKGKSASLVLPIESLWWNACLVGFCGQENLQQAVVDQHWDAGDLERSKAAFGVWCKMMLEKYHPFRKTATAVVVPKATQAVPRVVTKTIVADDTSSSSSEEDEKPANSQLLISSVATASIGSSDEDDDFVLVSGPRRGRSMKENLPTPSPPPESTDISATVSPIGCEKSSNGILIPEGLFSRRQVVSDDISEFPNLIDSCKTVEPPTCHVTTPTPASTSIFDEIDHLLVDDEDGLNSILEEVAPVVVDSVLESRMNLLPFFVRQYCLPIELIFVYYSEEYFSSSPMINVGMARTVSMVPPSIDEEAFLNAITMAAFNRNCVISRIFVSPHQEAATIRVSVQWFIELGSVMDCHKFATWVGTTHPEWVPEIGALLPASMLGFAV